MDTNNAARLGAEDARAIIRDANQLSLGLVAGERAIIVDGSAYSPSWRRLTNGSHVWSAAMCHLHGLGVAADDAAATELTEAYEEGLDRAIRAWDSPNGGYLVWDEGCLFIEIGEED